MIRFGLSPVADQSLEPLMHSLAATSIGARNQFGPEKREINFLRVPTQAGRVAALSTVPTKAGEMTTFFKYGPFLSSFFDFF